jgi:hypothetical protein
MRTTFGSGWPWVVVLLMAATPAATSAQAALSGEWSFESRGFFNGPLFGEQHRHDLSTAIRPQFQTDWDRGLQLFTFEPFVRLDRADGDRTHLDIRTLSWERAWRQWELRVGIRQVFWGVTESVHLVDVINQTDLVESLDGEDKLGQPMVNLAMVRDWGTVDFFLLFGFRERTFPGPEGRLRAPVPIRTDQAVYESSRGDRRIDWAVRWSHSLGEFDLGLAHFSGTSREPRLESGVVPHLTPHYDVISQTSLDLQWTHGGWLWKFEGLTRDTEARHWAMVGGFEYTLYQLFGGGADLGLLAEVQFDSRGSQATTPAQDDVFVGARLARNDVQSSQLLAGAIVDRKSGATLLYLEAQRRVAARWTVSLESRGFWAVKPGDPLYGLRRDAYVGLSLTRYF